MIRPFIVATLIPFAATSAQEFKSPRLDGTTSWIGNSYGGATKWVQQDIHAMTVTPDGTVFTNVEWDEAGGNAGEYRDGELIRYALHTHGWGNNGGEAVASNSRYVFLGVEVGNERGGLKDPSTWPPKGSKWYGVSRRTRADLSKGAPFEGGKGGKGDSLKSSFLVVSEVSDQTKSPIAGLCADESRLYVADPNESQIKVFDAETMQRVASWKIERAGPLALDREGRVWLLERAIENSSPRLVCFSAEGKEDAALKFGSEVKPAAFCFATDGRILVADGSSAQQVRIYSRIGNTLKEVGTFGERGGIGSGTPGEFADRKLNQITAIGCDAKDNLYVAHDAQSGGGGTVLESYRLADGKLNWRLLGLTFVDMADIDVEDDGNAFTKEERFTIDYTQPAGREWRYAAYTIGREKYPEDPRLHIWSAGAWVRHFQGRRILFVNDMNGDRLQVYRFSPKTDGEIAIPAGLFSKTRIKEKGTWPPNQPEKGEWIWRDLNGNGAFDAGEFDTNGSIDAPRAQGWWVDRIGNVWLASEKQGVRCFPLKGFDAQGNPQWDFKEVRAFPHPPEFLEVRRIRYDSAKDILYLGGTSADHKNQHWKPMGPIVARYDGWLKGDCKLKWIVTLPYSQGASGHESCEPMGFDVAGDFIFVPYTGASKKDGVKTGRVEIFRAADGSSVGHVEPGAEVGQVGLQDIRETLTAHRRANGEYVVLVEDDYKSKIVMYRIKNLK